MNLSLYMNVLSQKLLEILTDPPTMYCLWFAKQFVTSYIDCLMRIPPALKEIIVKKTEALL